MAVEEDGVPRKKSRRMAQLSPSPIIENPTRGVPSLPIDVWNEILLRTPAEDVVKFKGVCKAWHEVINSRNFAVSHLDRWASGPISGLVLDMDYRTLPVWWGSDIFYLSKVDARGSHRTEFRRLLTVDNYSCPCRSLQSSRGTSEVLSRSRESRVLGSCDGLILTCYAAQTHYQLLVCNPLTGSYRMLPVFRPAGTRRFGLWDSSDSYEWTMLRTASGQYKIFGIEKKWLSGRRCYILELQIHGNGQPEPEWKELEVPVPENWFFRANTTKEGKVHWLLTALPDRRPYRYYEIRVLSIDILKEEFSASVSVNVPCRVGRSSYFFASKGTFYWTHYNRTGEVTLRALEGFDTVTWKECWNFKNDSILALKIQPVWLQYITTLGDGRSLMKFDSVMDVLRVIAREFASAGLDPNFWKSRATKGVPHTNSLLLGCD